MGGGTIPLGGGGLSTRRHGTIYIYIYIYTYPLCCLGKVRPRESPDSFKPLTPGPEALGQPCLCLQGSMRSHRLSAERTAAPLQVVWALPFNPELPNAVDYIRNMP